MILTGEEIKKEIASGGIEIDPYDEKNVQPASIDLTLGKGVRIYPEWIDRVIDPKEEQPTDGFTIGSVGVTIRPGRLYLMHTHERIYTERFVSVLDGKSSIGRLGVVIHLTAGYGDPGFDGQYTLEVTCMHPIILYAGMKIAQMRFHTMQGDITTYKEKGHYVGVGARGAVPSMAHKQFEEL